MLSFPSDLQDHREWARARAAARTAMVLSRRRRTPNLTGSARDAAFEGGTRSIAITRPVASPHQTFRHSGPFGMTDGSTHEGRFDTSNVLPLDSPTGGSLTEFFELCEFEKAPAR